MIVSRRSGGLVVVMQVDHQCQCALMAAAWGDDDVARPEPFAPVERAAAWHDEGWRGWEAAPQVGPGGDPVDFVDIDPESHTALYRDAIAGALLRDARAGLLVSMHGQGLYERRLGIDGPPPDLSARPPAVREFVADQRALQATVREALGDGPHLRAWAWDAYRVLQAVDLLSIHMAWRALPAGRPGLLPRVPRWQGDAEGVDVHVTPAGPDTCALVPFPFRGDRLDAPVRARTIPDRRYLSHEDLGAELAAAEPYDLPCAAVRGQA